MRRLPVVLLVLVTSARTADADEQRRGVVLGAAIDVTAARGGDGGILREEWLGWMVSPQAALTGWARQQETHGGIDRRTQLGVSGRYWANRLLYLELHVARDHNAFQFFCDFPPCDDAGTEENGTLFGGSLGWDVVHLGGLVAEVAFTLDTTTLQQDVDRTQYGVRLGIGYRADLLPAAPPAPPGHRGLILGVALAGTNRHYPFDGFTTEGWIGWMVHPRLGVAAHARGYRSDEAQGRRGQFGGLVRWWPARTDRLYLELQLGHDSVDVSNPITGGHRWQNGVAVGGGPNLELARTPQVAVDLRLGLQASSLGKEQSWNGFVGLGVTAY